MFTLEGWVEVMYQAQDGATRSGAAVFFSLLVTFGSLFAINLTLAVLESNFSAAHLEMLEQAAEERKAFLSDKDRYDLMVEKNPSLDKLRKALDLDLG